MSSPEGLQSSVLEPFNDYIFPSAAEEYNRTSSCSLKQSQYEQSYHFVGKRQNFNTSNVINKNSSLNTCDHQYLQSKNDHQYLQSKADHQYLQSKTDHQYLQSKNDHQYLQSKSDHYSEHCSNYLCENMRVCEGIIS